MKSNLYVIVKDSATGELEGYVTSNGENHLVLNAKMVKLDYEANIGKLTPRVRDEYVLLDGALVALPPRLYDFQKMNYTTGQWFDPRTPGTQWPLVRAERDKRLAATDWTQLPDVKISSVWLTYRQALRDITNQSDPFNIVWPALPNA